MWTKGSCTPQEAPLGATPFNWTAYNETENAYPACGARMAHYRSLNWLPEGRRTDCDYQNYVRVVENACPPVPSHYTVRSDTSTSLADEAAANQLPAAVSCDPTVTPLDLILGSWQCDNETITDVMGVETLKYRMQRVWGTRVIMLDCKPWMMRGVSYSPVPWMHDPSYHEPYGDYFTDEYYDIVKRDLALFQEMGANTVRLYAWRLKTRHMKFLDLADELGLQVSSAFEMGTAEDTPLSTFQERALALSRLQRRLQVSKHRAITMWQVGNELNGAWQEYVCEDSYAEKFLHMPCIFKDNATRLCEFIDDMCRVVHSEGGWLCSTPLAGVNPPSKYTWGFAPYSATGWIQVCEGKKPLPEDPNPYAVQHVDFWSANLYPGKNFDGFNFTLYAGASDLPLLVSEYGIDAYNVNAMDPVKLAADPRDIGIEDGPMQSSWLMYLVEDLERHSSACEIGCEDDVSRVALGGSIMAWQDEWWKGRVIEAVAFDNRTDAMADERGSLCPDPLATRHSACGYPSGAQPDTYVNEEWFGLFTIHRPQCQSGDIDQVRARDAWFRLKLIWKYGSCLTFRGLNESLAPFNATEWPECGPELSRLRTEIEGCFQAIREWDNREASCEDLRDVTNCDWGCYNARAECDYWEEWATSSTCTSWSTFNWDGGDCEIMALIVDGRCPPVPEHMADLNLTMYYETSNWVDRPETCDSRFLVWFNKDGNGSRVIMLTLVVLCLLIINARRIEKMVREWLPRGASGSAAPPFCCLAFGCCFGGPVGILLAYLGYLCFDRLRRLLPRPAGPAARRLQRLAGERGQRRDAIGAARGGDDLDDGPAAAHHAAGMPVGVPARRRAPRAQRAVRALLLPIAEQLALCFGMQKLQTDFFLGYGLEEVPSNLSNQVDHLVHLLSQRFDRMKGGGLDFAPALRLAVSQVHDALLETYFNWMRHIRLRAHDDARLQGDHRLVHVQGERLLRAQREVPRRRRAVGVQRAAPPLPALPHDLGRGGQPAPHARVPLLHLLLREQLAAADAPQLRQQGRGEQGGQAADARSPGPVALPPSARRRWPRRTSFCSGSCGRSTSSSSTRCSCARTTRSRSASCTTTSTRPSGTAPSSTRCCPTCTTRNSASSRRTRTSRPRAAFQGRRREADLRQPQALLCEDLRREDLVVAPLRNLLPRVHLQHRRHPRDGDDRRPPALHRPRQLPVELLRLGLALVLPLDGGAHARGRDGALPARLAVGVAAPPLVGGGAQDSRLPWSHTPLRHRDVRVRRGVARVGPRRRAARHVRQLLVVPRLLHVGRRERRRRRRRRLDAERARPRRCRATSRRATSRAVARRRLAAPRHLPAAAAAVAARRGAADPDDLSDLLGRRRMQSDDGDSSGDGGVQTAAGVIIDASLLESVGMHTTWEVVALIYCVWQLILLLSLVGVAGRYSRFRSYVGSNIGGGRGGTKVIYTLFWVVVLIVKFSFEYFLVIEPMIGPSVALWTFSASQYGTEGPADFYCWDFNWIRGGRARTSRAARASATRSPSSRSTKSTPPRTSTAAHAALVLLPHHAAAAALVDAGAPLLRRHGHPVLVHRIDLLLLLAHYRRVYHAFSWSATVRNLPISVMQFNTKILAESGVTLIERSPEWYLEDGIQNEVPSLEACSTQWHLFAAAWNSIVSCLRTSDLLSNLERDELLFEPLREPLVREAFGVDSYVLFPTMLTSPVFSKHIWEQRQSSFPSVVRTLLQARDCTWYLLVQLNLVGERDQPPDAGVRRKFLSTVTRLAELEKAEHATRRMGDSAPLLMLLNAFRELVSCTTSSRSSPPTTTPAAPTSRWSTPAPTALPPRWSPSSRS